MILFRWIGILSIAILLAISSSICFAQEGPRANPHFPTRTQDIRLIKESLWKKIGDDLLAYKAVRKEDRDVCSEASNVRACQEKVSEILVRKYAAKGQCDYLNGDFNEVCVALKNNNCASLNGYTKLICQGIARRNLKLFLSGINHPKSIQKHGWTSKAEAETLINLYYGFKYSTEKKCAHFSPDTPFTKRISCKLLFGLGDIDQKIDSILIDLAYFAYAKETKKEGTFCSKIKDSFIKDACLNPNFKSLDDFLK